MVTSMQVIQVSSFIVHIYEGRAIKFSSDGQEIGGIRCRKGFLIDVTGQSGILESDN
jgi:hypothetical protein